MLPKLSAAFYAQQGSDPPSQPVRNWLKGLSKEEQHDVPIAWVYQDHTKDSTLRYGVGAKSLEADEALKAASALKPRSRPTKKVSNHETFKDH